MYPGHEPDAGMVFVDRLCSLPLKVTVGISRNTESQHSGQPYDQQKNPERGPRL